CAEMLKAAGAEHHGALVVNTASIAGKTGQGWLSIYSATKHGVVGFSHSMNKELGAAGVKSCALCPGFVDTPMTEFVKQEVSAKGLASRWVTRIRSSRSLARRARLLAFAKRSQERAKDRKLVRPPQRWAASMGHTPPLRSV